MFGISFGEMVLLLIIALIVIGPERLPTVVRTVGRFVGKMRGYTESFRNDLEKEFKLSELQEDLNTFRQQAELDELQKALRAVVEKGESEFNQIERSVDLKEQQAVGETLANLEVEALEDELFNDHSTFEESMDDSLLEDPLAGEMSLPPPGFNPIITPVKRPEAQNPWRQLVGSREEALAMASADERRYLTYHLNEVRRYRGLRSLAECQAEYRQRLEALNKRS